MTNNVILLSALQYQRALWILVKKIRSMILQKKIYKWKKKHTTFIEQWKTFYSMHSLFAQRVLRKFYRCVLLAFSFYLLNLRMQLQFDLIWSSSHFDSVEFAFDWQTNTHTIFVSHTHTKHHRHKSNLHIWLKYSFK